MSYEGYTQYLCPLGHYWCEDSYAGYYTNYSNGSSDSPTCPECKAKPVWENSVDETNGSYEDDEFGTVRVDGYVELEEKTPAQFETCAHCQHSKMIAPPTYHIPEVGGHKI